ncbi:alpha/beta hydrolase-fold protein [Paenibacillus sp.]|uniref:alpha/beta hydrolase n=1 Tax=Paenibacillus sp. TaxID=58172 RepID=UPI0028B099F5|nr:alpha/beta hydrolase-fold protein [Paenibacillus sp.]
MHSSGLFKCSIWGLIALIVVALSGCSGKGNLNSASSPTTNPALSKTTQASESPTNGVAAKGTVHIDKLGERRIFVYLPAGYESDGERYSVVYMHDGQNIFNTNTNTFSKDWRVEEIIDQLVVEGKMEKVIVIGVAASEGSERGKEYIPFPEASIPTDGTSAEEFTQYFIKTVIPYVDSAYRTIPERDHRMIMGSSFGAIQALWMGYQHPETFSSIGAVSPATWVGNGRMLEELAKESEKPELKIWLDMGVAEGMPIDPLVNLLLSKGFIYGKDLFFQMDPLGTHDEKSWNRRVHSPLIMFAGKGARQTIKLEVSDYLTLLGPEASDLRLNSVATMDNGMDYTISDGVGYQVLNPEVGQVDKTGKVNFLKPEPLIVSVSFQGVTKEHQINYDRYVKVLKIYLKSLVIEEQGDEILIHLKSSAEKLKTTTKYLSELVKSIENLGIYKIKEVQEDSILIVFNTN